MPNRIAATNRRQPEAGAANRVATNLAQPLAARIEALRRRHQAIDQVVQNEHLRPLPDGALLSSLKRKRLRLKDEMRAYEDLLRILARPSAP